MTSLSTLRGDVATVVADVLGITCASVYSGNPEPNVAQVRWGGTGAWLDFDPDKAGFTQPYVSLTVVITANAIDYAGAQEWLEEQAIALVGIGGVALENGGRCPPVRSIGEPSTLYEDTNLLAIEAQLAPMPRQL